MAKTEIIGGIEHVVNPCSNECGVWGCTNHAIEVSYSKWNRDHPGCTHVALCQDHYDLY